MNEEGSQVRKVNISKNELPHYSLRTTDFHFRYDFGWGEVCSLSDRGDYDLRNHSDHSGLSLGVKNKDNDMVYPHVIEVSFGLERLLLAILENSYCEELSKSSKNTRTYLKINPLLSPFFVAVMPLSNQLTDKARNVYFEMIKNGDFAVSYEETGNIGNRYRRQDAIGTFFCVTIDFETSTDNSVTVRERDSMKQERIEINKLFVYLVDKLNFLKKSFLE